MRARTADELRDVNVRYHDRAAVGYDAKWGIGYGGAGQRQVLAKLEKALGKPPRRFDRALEVGAGTGYFGLNLVLAGVVGELVATDISPGMLSELRASAERLEVPVETAPCDATVLPFPDSSFDLVLGHAVLHHLPELEDSFAEFRRVLRPGGRLAFCGEPSRYGDRLAALPKRAGATVAPAWRMLMGARRPGGHHPIGNTDHGRATHGGHEEQSPRSDQRLRPDERPRPDERRGEIPDGDLEYQVDVHAFTPGGLARAVRAAGFRSVRVSGEELTASWFGWTNRALEATAEPTDIPWLWRQYAYRGYLALQWLDRRLLEPRLPPWVFYNLLVSARAP